MNAKVALDQTVKKIIELEKNVKVTLDQRNVLKDALYICAQGSGVWLWSHWEGTFQGPPRSNPMAPLESLGMVSY